MKQLWFFLLSICFIDNALAGELDPIGWRTIGAIPPSVFVGQPYVVTYIFTNNAPFIMPTPIAIAKNTPNTAEFNFIDRCTGLKLAPLQQCLVIISLQAITTGPKSASLAIGYGNNMVPLPGLSTQSFFPLDR